MNLNRSKNKLKNFCTQDLEGWKLKVCDTRSASERTEISFNILYSKWNTDYLGQSALSLGRERSEQWSWHKSKISNWIPYSRKWKKGGGKWKFFWAYRSALSKDINGQGQTKPKPISLHFDPDKKQFEFPVIIDQSINIALFHCPSKKNCLIISFGLERFDI